MQTPWGTADNIEQLAAAVTRVGTPSHGGIRCNAAANARIPAALRIDSGWYEEDCEAHLVYAAFPELCRDADQHARAVDGVLRWFPERYAAWDGKPGA